MHLNYHLRADRVCGKKSDHTLVEDVVETEVLGQQDLVEVLVKDFDANEVGLPLDHDPVALELSGIELSSKGGHAIAGILEFGAGVALADFAKLKTNGEGLNNDDGACSTVLLKASLLHSDVDRAWLVKALEVAILSN